MLERAAGQLAAAKTTKHKGKSARACPESPEQLFLVVWTRACLSYLIICLFLEPNQRAAMSAEQHQHGCDWQRKRMFMDS
mmetsp:Transcript_85543/g.187872  ORF Transcript_85543/g.187872 Transcript_85543/m.187872 type:complete len:80 (-) Transcript_85543:430-669(-)